MRRHSLVAVLMAALAAAAPHGVAQQSSFVPEPREAPPCGFPEPVLFAEARGVAFEGLAFDGRGNLWLTAFSDGLWRAWPNGTLVQVVADDRGIPSTGPDDASAFMGIDVGPDGALYVAQGLSITRDVPARVLRFSAPGAPDFEVYADGLTGANGLAVTPDGTVYVAHGFRREVWRIGAPGQAEVWATAIAPNGLVEHPDGERLAYAQVGDYATTVRTMRLDDPDARETLMTFNAAGSFEDPLQVHPDRPLVTKAFDDLVIATDGAVYGASHMRHQVVRGDPASGAICIALDLSKDRSRPDSGGELSSVRIARGFGAWDGWLFSVDFAGEIWAIDADAEAPALDAPPAGALAPPAGDPQATPASVPSASVALVAVVAALAAAAARKRGR